MKRKIFTALLIGVLTLIPARSQPKKDNPVAICVVFAFGTVVVIGLYYVCRKLPPPPGTCNCGCGLLTCACGGLPEAQNSLAPPIGQIITNPPALQAKRPPLRLENDGYTPYGPGSFTDGQGNLWTYANAFSFALQSSTDLTNWQSFTVNGWLTTDGGALISTRSNGVTLANFYFTQAINPTNQIPFNLSGPKRFYRTSCK